MCHRRGENTEPGGGGWVGGWGEAVTEVLADCNEDKILDLRLLDKELFSLSRFS